MRKKSVLLWGYFGHKNFGDELLLDTVLEHISNDGLRIYVKSSDSNFNYPDVTVVDLDGPLKGMNSIIGLRWVKYIFGLIACALKVNVVLFSGGTVFDSTRGIKPTLLTLIQVVVFRTFNARLFSLGNGLNLGNSRPNNFILGLSLRLFEKLYFRDESSYIAATSLIGKDKVSLASDIVFSSKSIPALISSTNKKNDVLVVTFAASDIKRFRSRKNLHFDFYYNRFFNYAKENNLEIVLVSFQNCTEDNSRLSDLTRFLEFYPCYKGVRFLEAHKKSEVVAEIESARLVVGMRFHGHVIAAICGVPFFPISVDHKCLDLSSRFGLPISIDDLGFNSQVNKLISKPVSTTVLSDLTRMCNSMFDTVSKELSK